MHVGVSLFATDLTNDIRDVARAAEDAGFESLWVAEHTHIPTSRATPYPNGGELPNEYSHTLDPFVSLAAAAAVTERLKIGTGICLVTERDPIVLAKEVASLDLISGGRFLFGVGSGWNAEEMADHGVAYDERWDVLRDRMKLMQSLWENDVASYDGPHAKVSESWQWPKPVQQPMQVLVGGSSKKSMRHAVEYGTGWIPMPSTTSFGERLADLRAHAHEVGRPVPSVTLHAVRPEAGVIAHYAEYDIERCIVILPPHADTLPTLREWAGLVSA
ncbi:MAG TPA: LLM class F420-dependent oxidoreductase [Mycobacteriales bacterium]|nr:LLM class F420-dependent oxidoreductase [Mycobacteriales bacterium]